MLGSCDGIIAVCMDSDYFRICMKLSVHLTVCEPERNIQTCNFFKRGKIGIILREKPFFAAPLHIIFYCLFTGMCERDKHFGPAFAGEPALKRNRAMAVIAKGCGGIFIGDYFRTAAIADIEISMAVKFLLLFVCGDKNVILAVIFLHFLGCELRLTVFADVHLSFRVKNNASAAVRAF